MNPAATGMAVLVGLVVATLGMWAAAGIAWTAVFAGVNVALLGLYADYVAAGRNP